jgi:precorrin-3B synthase
VADPFQPGLYNGASCIAFAFGQIPAATLHLLTDAARSPIRLTPWHALAFMGQDLAHTVANHPDLIATPNDPLLRVTACTGAPGCPQAHAETRSLARSLAVHVPDGSHLHVSGCAKGCAHPGPAPVTLTATPNGFSLVRNRRAGDTPDLTGLGADMLRTSPDLFRALP